MQTRKIAAVIPIPSAGESGADRGAQKAALDAISQIAAGVDAKPKPRAEGPAERPSDDVTLLSAFF